MTDRLMGVTEFRTNAKQVIAELDDRPLILLRRSKPVAVVLRPDSYEDLLDALDVLTVERRLAQEGSDLMPLSELKELTERLLRERPDSSKPEASE